MSVKWWYSRARETPACAARSTGRIWLNGKSISSVAADASSL